MISQLLLLIMLEDIYLIYIFSLILITYSSEVTYKLVNLCGQRILLIVAKSKAAVRIISFINFKH